MANYYCKNCGYKNSSVATLTSVSCHRHPNGPSKGKHELYQGEEKSQYTCKYCGYKNSTIATLTAGNCHRHPNGVSKGKHSPAI
jgi:C4-type Zn-finger protein